MNILLATRPHEECRPKDRKGDSDVVKLVSEDFLTGEGTTMGFVFLLGLSIVGGLIIGIPLLFTGIRMYRKDYEKPRNAASIVLIIIGIILLLPATLSPLFIMFM